MHTQSFLQLSKINEIYENILEKFLYMVQTEFVYNFHNCIKLCVYNAPRRVLSRVGDRPTAEILHAQFHLFEFCFGFQGKTLDQNMPPLEGVNIK